METGRETWHLVDTLSLPGGSAGEAVLNSEGGTAIVSHLKQKWRQAECKAGLEWAFLCSKVRGGHRMG